uniref:Carbonyl reductase n=1 Tax=Echinococcus canadensis TaxID=519352 RepID=A0A915ETB8_9CEST
LDLGAVKAVEDKGLRFKFYQLNIADVDSRHKLAEFIRANYPNGIDIMVNSAGIAYVDAHTSSRIGTYVDSYWVVDFEASRIGTSNLTFVTGNWLSISRPITATSRITSPLIRLPIAVPLDHCQPSARATAGPKPKNSDSTLGRCASCCPLKTTRATLNADVETDGTQTAPLLADVERATCHRVTGANKGIGNGIVQLLVQGLKPASDWHVYLTARNEKLGMEAAKVFEDKGFHVKFHQLDITVADSRHKLTEYIKANYPNGIDILVNNAGIAYKLDSTAPFGKQARVTIATNYTATVNMWKEFLPLMAKDSRLVNVASLAAMMSLRNVEGDGNQVQGSLDTAGAGHAEVGDHEKVGFSSSAYGMSKVGLWKATAILAEQLKSDPRHILTN